MTIVDVIILSNTNSTEIFEMNNNAINSLLVSENPDEFKFNVVLVETCKTADYIYPQTKVIKPEQPFGYNLYMMTGYKYATGDFCAFCNNDLIFEKGWFSAIYEVSQKKPKILSFAPYNERSLEMTKLVTGIPTQHNTTQHNTLYTWLRFIGTYCRLGNYSKKGNFQYCA